MAKTSCPLCKSKNTIFYHEDDIQQYFKCPNCQLVFVPPAWLISPKEEKERYDIHENDPNDQRYRDFLSRLFDPLNEKLPPSSKGLDFGSGPGPTLHLMFEEAGHVMNIYDVFYADNPAVFDEKYDFITSTEVFEHLHHPKKEFNRLWSCLRPGGFLGIMTKRPPNDKEAFKNWHYMKDKTHVAFFSKATFRWIAGQWQARVSFPRVDVAIFQKKIRKRKTSFYKKSPARTGALKKASDFA